MAVECVIRIFAGFMVLLSLALGVRGSPVFASENFLWLTAFAGANLFQPGFCASLPSAETAAQVRVESVGCRRSAVT